MDKLGIIGIGNMGFAMLKGASHIFQNEQLLFTDVNKDKMEQVKKDLQINYVESNEKLVEKCKYIVVAVKPQYLDQVIHDIKDFLTPDKVVISIVLGYSIMDFKNFFHENTRVVRTMPNTPALINQGMTGICFSEDTFSQEEKTVVTDFFGAFGKYEIVEEKWMDAVVCASGSSPAYVYMFIEALADGAVKYGLPRDKAYRMAAQTVVGAAQMVLETGEHPGKLKDQVCSPGGSTIAGVSALEEFGFRNAVIKAADQCYAKATSVK